MKVPRTALVIVAVMFAAMGVLVSRTHTPGGEALVGAAGDVSPAAFWESQLPDLTGRDQPLTQWRGKVLVVNFWATWCPPCRNEIPGFIRLQERHGAAGVQFLGLAVDGKEPVTLYARQMGFNYPLLLAGENAGPLFMASGNAMGGLPYTVVFDRQGAARATFTGEVSEARLEEILKTLL